MNTLNNFFVRIMLHLGFWVLSYFVLIELFAYTDNYTKADYIYTGVFIFSLIIPVYINNLILIPFFLPRKLFFAYIALVDMLVALGAIFNYYLFNDFVDFIFPGYYFISYYSMKEIVIFFVAFMLITTLFKLSKDWFNLLETKRKLGVLEKEKIQAEMKMLKSHLDPHFLFNSLNVIYSLARKNNENTSGAVIQLSDIMRFITYDAKQDEIDINEEIALIEKYIALQNYRLESETTVKFAKKVEADFQIAPLLLLPLVENAYKHGIKGNIQNGWIKINLNVSDDFLIFKISNSVGDNLVAKDSKKGSGINNIQNRLDLIYPGKYTFKAEKEQDVFIANLKIQR
jgi:sensor histidine kinase YesM